MDNMNEDNRKHPRYVYVQLVTLSTMQGRSYISESENISMGGIFLVKDNPLPVDTRGSLSIKFDIEKVKKEISAKFRVTHNGLSQKGTPGMGIEFIDLSQEDKLVIKEVLDILQNK